jgi:hypothetical protein
MMAWLRRMQWEVEVPLAAKLGASRDLSDDEVVALLLEHLMAVPVEAHIEAELVALIAVRRKETGTETPLLAQESEDLLEQVVHVILSLPEAQML